MTDALGDLLKQKRFDEPPEIQIIKSFVKEKYNVDPGVTVHARDIVISVKSAALAGTLRMQLHQLQQMCQTEKRLVIRIT